jgi:hypothetical protein|tara:strand:+ start:1177 stop:1437 length:261 start_codon:yes stop_codon:yes gene_type:complete
MFWTITFLIVFLVLWGLAWKSQPKLALGIFIGLCLGSISAFFIGPYESLADVPIWLPPLPFITITVVLLIYGFLTWTMLGVKKKSD